MSTWRVCIVFPYPFIHVEHIDVQAGTREQALWQAQAKRFAMRWPKDCTYRARVVDETSYKRPVMETT